MNGWQEVLSGPHERSRNVTYACRDRASEEALARAQAAAQAKRFGEAAGICDDVLAAAPDHAPALALQGMIAAHTNDPERGITLLERAVTLRPASRAGMPISARSTA